MTTARSRAEAEPLPALLDRLSGWSPEAGDLEAAWLRVADAACAVRFGSSLAAWRSARRAFARDSGAPAPWDGGGPGAPAGGTAAALAACCRITEVDDIELATCTTPGSVVVPAALATLPLAGAATHAPGGPDERGGDRFLAAVASGYEVVVGAAALLGGAFAPGAGVWPSRAVAALGAAATAVAALGLTSEVSRHAVALAAAASFAGTFPEPARSWSLGMAVGCGVGAALAAAEGLRGDVGLLARWPAGRYGEADPAQVALVAGALANGTSAVRRSRLKPYAGARQVLAGSATLRALVEAGEVDPGDVATALLAVPGAHARMVDRPLPEVRLDTLASAQYQLALALDAPRRLDELDHRLPPPASVAARMAAVHVVAEDPRTASAPAAPAAPAAAAARGTAGDGFPARWGARLELVRNGSGRTCHVARSVPGEEAFGWEDVEGKARRLAAANRESGIGAGEIDELLATVRRRDWGRLEDALAAGAMCDEGGAR